MTACTRSAPERIDRDRERQRRVHAARQAHHDAREAVLVDVVAHAEHQRPVDALLVRTARARSVPASGTSAAATALELDAVQAFLERRRRASTSCPARPSRTSCRRTPARPGRRADSRTPPAAATSRDAIAEHLLALALLVDLVGRGVDDQQQPRRRARFGRLRPAAAPRRPRRSAARAESRRNPPPWPRVPGVK